MDRMFTNLEGRLPKQEVINSIKHVAARVLPKGSQLTGGQTLCEAFLK